MAYVPQNAQAFTAAYAGALAGSVVDNRPLSNASSPSYNDQSAVIGAFAQAFDTLRGSAAPDTYEVDCILKTCQGVWISRQGFSTNAADYTAMAQAVLNVISSGSAYLASIGFTPPPYVPGGATPPAAPLESVQYNNGGSFGGAANVAIFGSDLQIKGAGGTTIISTASTLPTMPFVLPATQGAVNSVLANDGAGNLSWESSANVNPGAPNRSVQFNESGAFGGASAVAIDTDGTLQILSATNYTKIEYQGATNFAWLLPTSQGPNTFLRNDGTGVLSWAAGTGTTPPAGATNILQYNAGGGNFGGAANLAQSGGNLAILNAGGPNSTLISSVAGAVDIPFVLPAAQGGANTFLRNDGAGNLTWVAGTGATLPAAPANSVQFNNAGAFGGASNLAVNGGDLEIFNTGGPNSTLISTVAGSPAIPFILPAAQGALNTFLRNDGAGNLTWVAGTGATLPAAPVNSLQFNSAGSFGGATNLAANGGNLEIFNTGGPNSTLISSASGAVAVPFILPAAQGADRTHLQNDGSGNLSWGLIGATINQNTILGPGAMPTNAPFGNNNTIIGSLAGANIVNNSFNVAVGSSALHNCLVNENTAVGVNAAFGNQSGNQNVAVGFRACSNIEGGDNTGVGHSTMVNALTGTGNTALGSSAMGGAFNNGNYNVAIGRAAGIAANISGAIAIGAQSTAAAAFANIQDGLFFHRALAGVTGGTAVTYNAATGQMGPAVSAARFKENIRDLEVDSAKIFELRPVSYELKAQNDEQIDMYRTQIGFLAEDVAEVFPEIVPVDGQGKPFSVNYDKLTVLLIEELRKAKQEIAILSNDVAILKARG